MVGAAFDPAALHPLLAGRRVVVSGGTSGIGLALAHGFAQAGCDVTATGSNAAKVAEFGAWPGLAFARLDVRDRGAPAAFFGALASLDVLVNCQGVARPEDEWTEATFDEVIDVNLASVQRMSEAALPLLRASSMPGGGAVVNFASMLSFLADASVPAYTASKTGILGLTRAQAHRYGPIGVRVNAVAPGYHRTEMTRELWASPPDEARIAARAALKRWGTAEDLVGRVLFLASPLAAFVSGTTLPVDGGYVSG